jgi:hypothetical protein
MSELISNVVGTIGGIVTSVLSEVRNIASQVVSNVKQELVNIVSEAVKLIVSLIVTPARFLVDFMLDLFSDMAGRILSIVAGIIPAITKMMDDLISQTYSDFDAMVNAIRLGFDSTFEWARREMDKLESGIRKNLFPWVDVGEYRFANASAKALATYWMMSRLEDIITGRKGIIRGFIDLLLFPLYGALAEMAVNIATWAINEMSQAKPGRIYETIEKPPIAEYPVYKAPPTPIEFKPVKTISGSVYGPVVEGYGFVEGEAGIR